MWQALRSRRAVSRSPARTRRRRSTTPRPGPAPFVMTPIPPDVHPRLCTCCWLWRTLVQSPACAAGMSARRHHARPCGSWPAPCGPAGFKNRGHQDRTVVRRRPSVPVVTGRSDREQGQAHFPAEQPPPCQEARVPAAHAHSRRPGHRGHAPSPGPRAAFCLIASGRASHGSPADQEPGFPPGGPPWSSGRTPPLGGPRPAPGPGPGSDEW